MSPARMRTINECLNEIREFDPRTSITYNFVKTLCEQGKIKYIKNGRKYFVNLDDLLLRLSE